MQGFAVAALHVSPKVFWEMTPIEFNAAADAYLRIMEVQTGLNLIQTTRTGGGNPWSNPDLAAKAKKMLED